MRVYKRINDVFEVELPDCKRYFQFLQIDTSWLYGDVIAIFSNKYDISESPDVNDIVKGPVEYYCHTSVNCGVKLGMWKKYGNAPSYTDMSAIYFRNFTESLFEGKGHWHIWRVNEKLQSFDKIPEQFRDSYVTYLFSPYSVDHKIRYGKFPGQNVLDSFLQG